MLIAFLLAERGEGPGITIDPALALGVGFFVFCLLLGAAIKISDWWKRWKDGRGGRKW